MKQIAFILAAVACLALCQVRAEEATWLTSLPKALEQAKTQKKNVLIDFTGSDWCGWCIKFKKEVLSTPDFAKYAGDKLVLVELDFPRTKEQSDELKKANQALSKKYSVEGFPTLVVLNADGKEIGRQVGYLKGGPSAFIEKLNGFGK